MASKSAKKKNKGAAKKKGFPTVAVVVTVLVIAVGVGVGVLIATQSSGDDSELETGIALPSFAKHADAPPGTEKAYQVALTIPDDLAQIPCYCGCSADGHQSNLDCFIDERNGDNVIFDDHAAY